MEHFKRTGIEELSGTMVYLKQVKKIFNNYDKCFKCQASCATKALAANQLLVSTAALWKLLGLVALAYVGFDFRASVLLR